MMSLTRLMLMDETELLKRPLKSTLLDAPARQQSLQSLAEWALELLEPRPLALLVELAVFPSTFSLEDAEAVVETDSADQDLLFLRQHSLIQPLRDQRRFRIYPVIRRAAEVMLAEAHPSRSAMGRVGSHPLPPAYPDGLVIR